MPGSAFPPDLSVQDVLSAIERKNGKYRGYCGECGELWLLLHSDAASTASWLMAGVDVVSRRFRTVFDRVFVLSLVRASVVAVSIDHESRS